MEDYNKNLILKHQKNLVSSLGMKFDEQLNKYLFVHKKKVMKRSFKVSGKKVNLLIYTQIWSKPEKGHCMNLCC